MKYIMIKNYHSLIFIYNIIGTQRVGQIKQFFFCQKIYYYIGKTIKMQTNEFFFTFLKKIIFTIPVFCQLWKLNVKKQTVFSEL